MKDESEQLSTLFHPSALILHPFGEVQEWLNWQHWKCCVRETVPWVRIPPSPPSGLRQARFARRDFEFEV
jgi:hypothetical protein